MSLSLALIWKDCELKATRKSNEVFGRRGNGAMTPKDQSQIDKIREYLDRITRLSEEKTSLALELRRLITRSAGRLDYDLGRIRKALGDPTSASTSANGANADLSGLGGTSFPTTTSLVTQQILPQIQAHQIQQMVSMVVPAQNSFRAPTIPVRVRDSELYRGIQLITIDQAAVQLQEAIAPPGSQAVGHKRKHYV
jgi:hypothetical protein